MSKPDLPPLLLHPNPLGFWDLALETMAKELSPQQFKTWIQPLKINGYDESERLLLIGAPNPFKLDWIKRTFSTRLHEIASSYFGAPINLQFTLAADPSKSTTKMPSPSLRPEGLTDGLTGTTVSTGPAPNAGDLGSEFDDVSETNLGAALADREHSKLNPGLTFESFVTGKANQLARAASIQVAHNPGASYNPMFL